MSDVGDVKKLELLGVKDDTGAPTDPEAITLTIRTPAGATVTATFPAGGIVREALGNFFFNLPLTEEGVYEYRWVTVGGVDLSEGGTLVVGRNALGDPFPDEDFTVGMVWARSMLLKDRYPQGSSDGDLSMLVATAAPLVGSLTGRVIAGTEGEAVPASLNELALRAIAMKTEQLDSAIGTSESRTDMLERSGLRSIAAGSWSESYFGPGEAARSKQLDSDPVLAEVLWALCTEDKKAEWLALWDPEHAPGFSVIESFDYSRRPGGY